MHKSTKLLRKLREWLVTDPNYKDDNAEGQKKEVAENEAHNPEYGESHTDELILAVGPGEEVP